MNKSRKTGFTLVELLAVIVILAIILVIAVPKVMNVIEDAKKATLESTAKMIATAAEKQKVQNQVLGKNDEITCESVSKINDIDYASCKIAFEDNIAKVTIIGKGKFEGMSIVNATKNNAVVTPTVIEPLIKYGRLYERKGGINLSYVFYDDGSFMVYNEDNMTRNPYNTVLYNENKFTVGDIEGTVLEDGNQLQMSFITAELNESPLYYGLPYVAEIPGANISFVFYPSGYAVEFVNNELNGEYLFTIDSSKINVNSIEMELSEDGKTLKISEADIPFKLIENPVRFKEPYSFEFDEMKASVSFSKSGIVTITEGNNSVTAEGIYLDGYLYGGDNTFIVFSDNKNSVMINGVLLTLENNIQREIIPTGGTYTTGYVYNSSTLTFDESNTITYEAGDYFPENPQLGDKYIYGDYEYRYGLMKTQTGNWVQVVDDLYVNYVGWGVAVLDKTKTEYDSMLSFVNNTPVSYANYTYDGCTSLTYAPKIPLTIITMIGTFHECTALQTAPVIESVVGNIDYVFKGCTNLSVNVEINTDTTSYNQALLGTKVTVITGDTPYKNEILATKE